MDTATIMVPPFSPASALTFALSTSSLNRQGGVASLAVNQTALSLDNSSNASTDQGAQSEVKPFQWGMLGLTLIIVCTAVGNLLVCLAVCWEKRLQNMTNYFLMSLAIADFLVSLLVMPLGMVVEIFGYFPMNPEICVLWVASDVLMCSASIWHMCTMSMDRYFTLNYPMRYGRNKTRRMVAGKILFVWIVSMAISTPVCIHGFIDTSIVYNDGMCVPVLKDFLIYGSIFAFYIPLLIMLVTYILTIRILWKNQQRMKHIDRSDLKPRLAQLTAQCTGFAIPKLLTSLRRPSKSPSVSQTPSPTPRSDTRLLRPHTNNMGACGHINATMSDTDLRSARRKAKETANFLSPPNRRPCFPRSASSHVATDTEDSESEYHHNNNNYFSLLQSSQSCRSLCTTVNQTTTASTEKSLRRQLQKRQLYQQTRHDLLQRSTDTKQQRYCPINRGESSPSSPDMSSGTSCARLQPPTHLNNVLPSCSSSSTLVTSSKPTPAQPTSPLFNDAQPLHSSPAPCTQPHHPSAPPSTNETLDTARSPVTDNRQKDTQTSQKQTKKKRYSKRCKRRRVSLSMEQEKPNNLLEVPSLALNRRVRSNKQTNELTGVLLSAKSDTQVSQAGRGMTSELEQDASVPFHHNQSKMSKDYKSLEWDRRYFQIQEEMDLCLKGEFNRRDRGESIRGTDLKTRHSSETDTPETPNEHKQPKVPDASSPASMTDPLDAQGCLASHYSHSAPNSPLNRRASLSFSSGSESSGEDNDDEVDNENTSDKNNADDDDNDTSNSSNNDDVITIRLQPPSPKAQGGNQSQPPSNLAHGDALPTSSAYMKKELNSVTMNSDLHHHSTLDPGCYIELKHQACCTHNHASESNHHLVLNNIHTNPTVTTCASTQSLSPANSPLPELVISSEGEMTLEETDDTLDGSPNVNRIKLRRPTQPLQNNKHRFRKKHQTAKGEMTGEKYSKSRKRPSFKNTFRIHRGKAPTKHVLSKKTASNEKKASKVLGIIFLVFVILWTPFFTVNILSAVCTSCIHHVNQETMSLFLWMGYIASLANPIIYTMFNTAFRRTFIRILTCKIQRTCSTKTSDNPYMSYTTMLASERRNTMTVVLRDESR